MAACAVAVVIADETTTVEYVAPSYDTHATRYAVLADSEVIAVASSYVPAEVYASLPLASDADPLLFCPATTCAPVGVPPPSA